MQNIYTLESNPGNNNYHASGDTTGTKHRRSFADMVLLQEDDEEGKRKRPVSSKGHSHVEFSPYSESTISQIVERQNVDLTDDESVEHQSVLSFSHQTNETEKKKKRAKSGDKNNKGKSKRHLKARDEMSPY